MITNRNPAFLSLFLLISFGSVSAVLFTPALPEISMYFGVTHHAAEITVTLFLIGYAVGQLLYGPLANAYGRKPALYIGIILEIVSALVCVLSGYLHAFWLLVVARLFMALGASVGLKMSFTLVADCYNAAASTRIISHLMMAFAITPALGIALGGFLTQHFGWQSCFYFLALYGIFLLYLTYRMQETATIMDRNALKLSNILDKYTRKLKNRQLLLSAAIMGSGTSIVYVFAAFAPFLTIQWMHMSPSEYGLWNLLPPIGTITGAQLSAFLVKKLRPINAILFGLVIMFAGTLLMLMAFALHALLAIWLFLPLAIIYFGMAFVYANASTLAMQSVQDKSSASAMMNFINMSIATLSVLLIGFISHQSSLLLPLFYGMLILLAFSLFIGLLRNNTSYDVQKERV
ncbi:MFS transporter [soil metagenome]